MNTAYKIVSILFILLLSSAFLVSCDDNAKDEDLEGLTSIRITSGNRQTERVGAVLPEPTRRMHIRTGMAMLRLDSGGVRWPAAR